MKRVALYLQDAHPLQDCIRYAKYAEEKGFEAVWQAESRLVRDAIVPMAAYAAVTSKIKVGSGVINNWTRNIGLLAATFLTLDDLAPNRILCGIGAWWDPLARNVGIDRRKPLLAMKETIEIFRRLLRLENVTFEGEFHRVHGIELDVVHGRREPRNVPVLIGATGDKMLELTGELADGCLLNYCVPPSYNDRAMELLASLGDGGDETLSRTLSDIRTISLMGQYYAHKIQGATELALFRATGDEAHQDAAVAELTEAARFWDDYTAAARSQYVNPFWTNRVGYVDWDALTAEVQRDIEIARGAGTE